MLVAAVLSGVNIKMETMCVLYTDILYIHRFFFILRQLLVYISYAIITYEI